VGFGATFFTRPADRAGRRRVSLKTTGKILYLSSVLFFLLTPGSMVGEGNPPKKNLKYGPGTDSTNKFLISKSKQWMNCHRRDRKNCTRFVEFPLGITSIKAFDFERNPDLKSEVSSRTTNSERSPSAALLGFSN